MEDNLKLKNQIKTLKDEIKQKTEELELLQTYLELEERNPGLNLYFKYYEKNPNNLEKIKKLINTNSLSGFIIFCLNNLKIIRKNKIDDFEIEKWDKKLEVLYIDFRIQPHYEFIIRNNILKLHMAKHTLICGTENYDFFSKLKIKNLEIINKNLTLNTINQYSELLSQTSFWEELTGEYILICQSDSIIFSDKIDKFYGYDYLGAPWIKPVRPKQFFQGNGGFSLRKREKMIEISKKYPINKMPVYLKPVNFMKNPSDLCPEDVYFCQYLNKDVESILPSFDLCNEFSIESFNHPEPFGGHKFFEHPWIKYFTENNYILNYNKIDYFKMDNEIENLNLSLGKISIVKVPKVSEMIIFQDNKIINHKLLNSEKGFNYIKLIETNNKLLDRKKKVYFKKVLIYKKRYDHNWRHFLIETFFDLACAYKNKDITILITRDAPKHFHEIFTILNITNFYEISDYEIITCDEIILNPIIDKNMKDEFLKILINQSVKIYHFLDKLPIKKLFLTRKNDNPNYRYVTNQDKLNEKIKKLDFEFFEGGTVPLFQQIAMINSADIIVTQIGANCDNIIFCHPKAKFKIIYPFNCKKWARMYQEYPQCELLYCGNQYQNNGDSDKYNWNYTIDFSLFKL